MLTDEETKLDADPERQARLQAIQAKLDADPVYQARLEALKEKEGPPDAAYVPGVDGRLVARILEGEARTWWEAVSTSTTDEDLKRAARLIDYILGACVSGDRETLDLFDKATRVLAGSSGTKEARLVRYVLRFGEHARDARSTDPRTDHARYMLAGCDEAFSKLSLERLREALKEARPDSRGRRGGIMQGAAELAVECGALGFGQRDGESFDAAVARAKERLKEAVKNNQPTSELPTGG